MLKIKTRFLYYFTRNIIFIVLILLSVSIYDCKKKSSGEYTRYDGWTMGTIFIVKWHHTVLLDFGIEDIQKEINNELKALNLIYSTYIDTSELSKFNHFKDTIFHPCSIILCTVIQKALQFSRYSNGAYDITMGPLISFWGFEKQKELDHLPSSKTLKSLLKKTGYQKIIVRKDKKSGRYFIKKKQADIYINLSSIAKGHAVDSISYLLERNGITDYMVNIGGEIHASGKNKNGKYWRLGINTPKKDAGINDVIDKVKLKNQSLASSGTYRNFYKLDGKFYHHILDGRTGYPVSNNIVSASIISESCMDADALATLLLILGKKDGFKLIEKYYPQSAYLVIEENKTGNMQITRSANWPSNRIE
jgi:thiamine biosynthesis lipoprotein